MKTLKWFKTGELIPNEAVYIKTENKVVGYKENSHPRFEDVPVYEEFHLYEIKVALPEVKKNEVSKDNSR